MTEKEKMRFLEILFYLYFSNKDDKIIKNPYFWKHIEELCKLYVINYSLVQRSLRTLILPENVPTPEEQMYYFNKAGISVRNIKAISGIYWQKQIELIEKNKTKPIVVRNIIINPMARDSLYKFIKAINNTSGIFKYIDDII